jgi:hypothetical protein
MRREPSSTPMLEARLLVALVSVHAFTACGGPELVAVADYGGAVLHHGSVVAARGPTMAHEGDVCELEVTRADGEYLNCRIRVRCHGDTVYGLDGAGYNRCRVEGDELIFAHDTTGTRSDGDPRLFFDLRTRRVIISDDEPDEEILVDLLVPPPSYARAAPPPP